MADPKVLKKLQDEIRTPLPYDEAAKSKRFHPSSYTTLQFLSYYTLLKNDPDLSSRKAELMVQVSQEKCLKKAIVMKRCMLDNVGSSTLDKCKELSDVFVTCAKANGELE